VSSPPEAHTPSTTTMALGLCLRMACAKDLMSTNTPVEVSTWVRVTILNESLCGDGDGA
jgi:hypothetical protein